MPKFIYPVKLRVSRNVMAIILCVFVLIVFNKISYVLFGRYSITHARIVEQFYQRRKSWQLSKLGNVLYKNEEYPEISEEKRNKKFLILIWRYWKHLQIRHLYNYGPVRHDPLSGCSVKNCEFTGDDKYLRDADAVVVYIHHGKYPSSDKRHPNQRWILLNDEAPPNAFNLALEPVPLGCLYSIFNWSMTYASDSDIPVPYGRTVALKSPKFLYSNPPITDLVPYWENKRRDVLVAILISDCTIKYRTNLIKNQKNHIKLDIYGKCGDKLKKRCPGHYDKECKHISQYLFYLVVENARCREYLTEKLFHHAYSKGAIPVIQGPSLEDCENLLPPNSFLHVDNYASLIDLANDLRRIATDEKKLLHYHKWRNHFEVLGEHGYFGTKSVHLCRVCEAMHYNDDAESVYSKRQIYRFLSTSDQCQNLV